MNDQQALEKDYKDTDFTAKEYSATIDYLRHLRLFCCQDLRDEKVKHSNTFILTGDSRLRSGRRFVLQHISVPIISGL